MVYPTPSSVATQKNETEKTNILFRLILSDEKLGLAFMNLGEAAKKLFFFLVARPNFWTKKAIFFAKYCNKFVKKKTLPTVYTCFIYD